LAKWGAGGRRQAADAAWDNLMMGLRAGTQPRVVVTTTPRPGALLKRVIKLAETTHGATEENVHLPGAFVGWMRETYGGTRLGRGHGRERAAQRGRSAAGEAGQREPRQGGARRAGRGLVRERPREARGAVPGAGGRIGRAADRRGICRAGPLARQGGRDGVGDERADAAERRAAILVFVVTCCGGCAG